MKRIDIVLTGLITTILTFAMVATIPAATISYQGMLTDAGGDPIPDGSYSVHVAFFDDSVGGTMLWEETHPNVQISNGLFGLVLGSVEPIAGGWYGAASEFDVWLEVDVDGANPFSPRTLMTSVPQAMNAHRVTGDILTQPGLFELHPSAPGVVGGPNFAGFRLNVDSTISKWKLFPPGAVVEDTCGGMEGTVETELVELNLSMNAGSQDPCDSLPGLKLLVDSSKVRMFLQKHRGGSSVDITANWSPSIALTDPTSMTAINLGIEPNEGGLFSIRSSAAFNNDLNSVEIHTDASQASLSMFGGQADAIPDILMTANGADGGMIGINTDAPTEALYVVGNIVATGQITAFTDTKVKKNIETVVDALDTVCKLRGVTYDMRRDEYPQFRFSDKRQLGFLAEEVQAVVPHVVLGDGNNLKSVDYGRLTPLLVEAIKELRLQNEQLKQRIEQLESR